MTGYSFSTLVWDGSAWVTLVVAEVRVAAHRANGPEGELAGWDQVDWGQAEQNVRRLRQRIFAASQAGDLKKVRNLQKLMLRSRSNALVSVRRVTEINAGRKTAGVDGRTVTGSQDKADMAAWLQHGATAWTPLPVRRVYVPKSNGRRRPLGIPVIADRALQALAVNALEPEWEARFEPKSYGFRPGRGCHDAIVAIHTTASRQDARRLWVLDADLEAAFDRLSHQHILSSLGSFPARELVRQWLRAGVLEDGRLTPTGEGTPQGGVISPALMNVALHGMEQAAGVRYWEGGTLRAVPGSPVLVRYADDLAVLCASRAQAEQVKARLAEWLRPRGLAFNEAKTKIVHLSEGFDFLGFNIRRYPNGKLLTKPSKDALRQIRRRLSAEMKALRGANADAVTTRLNPIITGWAAYYRIGVSKHAYNALDAHLWRLAWKWARFSHPNKLKRWVMTRYFGMSTRPGRTSGSSAAGKPASTSASSPGPKSSGTPWSPGGRLPTIPPSPDTGNSGAAAPGSRWTRPPGTCCAASAAGAHFAGDCCCTPITSRKARRSGSSGTPPRARRSASTGSPA